MFGIKGFLCLVYSKIIRLKPLRQSVLPFSTLYAQGVRKTQSVILMLGRQTTTTEKITVFSGV